MVKEGRKYNKIIYESNKQIHPLNSVKVIFMP